MHPAYSVILFTTASGAGYGLLIWLAAWLIFGDIGSQTGLALVSMVLAVALISIGLLSSTFHLGRPERAWRAFSQWRTSWLSREGVLAVLTYGPAALLAGTWVFWRAEPAWLTAILAGATIVLALATVWCTGMIYQSLPTIPHWHRPIVAPTYIALALSSGGVLLAALLHLFGKPSQTAAWLAIAALVVALGMKLLSWRQGRVSRAGLTAGAATGLGSLGRVRVLEEPHSRDNFVMREMGYQVARRHAERLRRIAVFSGFVVPALALLLSLWMVGPAAIALSVLAVVAAGIGIVTERWLFFAEARHVVTLFYGAEAL